MSRVEGPPSVGWSAFNLDTGQLLAGIDTMGVPVEPGYLATFTFRASTAARGRFAVELRSDATDSSQRTFLFPTSPTDIIAIVDWRAAELERLLLDRPDDL